MTETIFAFSCIVHTIQAEQNLLKAGLQVSVMPLPPTIRAGCWMCLRLPLLQTHDAEISLQESGITPHQIYTRTEENGHSVFSIVKREGNGK